MCLRTSAHSFYAIRVFCCRLRIPLAKATITSTPSGESRIVIGESVRDYDVYIMNTVSRHVAR